LFCCVDLDYCEQGAALAAISHNRD